MYDNTEVEWTFFSINKESHHLYMIEEYFNSNSSTLYTECFLFKLNFNLEDDSFPLILTINMKCIKSIFLCDFLSFFDSEF